MSTASKDDLFLGIDLGTSSCKVVAVDSWGRIVSQSVNQYKLYVSEGGRAEQDPEEWWGAVVRGIRETASSAGKGRIRSIGVTGQWSGTVALDENGNPLAPAIIWMDTRGENVIRHVTGGFPSISGYRLDKLIKWVRYTGGAPAHSGKDSIAHILYIKNFLPEIYKRTYKFVEPKDFIVCRLTGVFAASWDNAALLWSTDNRNPLKVQYSDSLISMNTLDRSKLPDLVPPTYLVGNVLGSVCDATGLPRDVSVISGCGDMQCSLVGAGAVDNYETLVYLGTSSWVTAHVPFKKTDIFHNIASLPSALPGKYFIAAEQENAGNCLEYISELLSIRGPDRYEEINKECMSSPPGSNGLLFLPWIFGERAPVENPFVRGGFFNLSLNNSRADFLRSVMEGVALNSKWLFEIVEAFMGRRQERVLMAGGGALSQAWAQIYADALNRSILVVRDPRYATAKGAALLSAVGCGIMNTNELKVLAEGAAEYTPNPSNAEQYMMLYKQFIQYYKNNRKAMEALNSRTALTKKG